MPKPVAASLPDTQVVPDPVLEKRTRLPKPISVSAESLERYCVANTSTVARSGIGANSWRKVGNKPCLRARQDRSQS